MNLFIARRDGDMGGRVRGLDILTPFAVYALPRRDSLACALVTAHYTLCA
jgi:hypothetical protein